MRFCAAICGPSFILAEYHFADGYWPRFARLLPASAGVLQPAWDEPPSWPLARWPERSQSIQVVRSQLWLLGVVAVCRLGAGCYLWLLVHWHAWLQTHRRHRSLRVLRLGHLVPTYDESRGRTLKTVPKSDNRVAHQSHDSRWIRTTVYLLSVTP